MRKSIIIILSLVLFFTFVSCKKDKEPTEPTKEKAPTPVEKSTEETTKPIIEEWDGAYISEEGYKEFIISELESMYDTIQKELNNELKEEVKKVFEKAYSDITNAKYLNDIKNIQNKVSEDIKDIIPKANGIYYNKYIDSDSLLDIYGLLENYSINNGIYGLPIMDNADYYLVSDRITLGVDDYIQGFGFGVLPHGKINSPLEYETNPLWKMYYHTEFSTDTASCNIFTNYNNKYFYDYIKASFYTIFANSEKNGYDWVPELAVSDRPIAVDADEYGLANTWKIEVKTGDNGNLRYNINSEDPLRSAFNNRPVALEDYLYPYKLTLTQSNGFSGGEIIIGSGEVKGAKDYYNASMDGFDEEAWKNVGIRVYEENDKPYFEVTFVNKITQYYAMHNMSALFHAPIPEEFIDVCGVENYGSFSKDGDYTPVDNTLSLGPYTLESWDKDNQVVFKKNPNYVYANTLYEIEGVHVRINENIDFSPSQKVNDFIDGKIDEVTQVNYDLLPDELKDVAKKVPSYLKLALSCNTCDYDTWVKLFGSDDITDINWDLKPILNNKYFLKGLSYSLNRSEYANNHNGIPTLNRFVSSLMGDFASGITYNNTNAHIDAIKELSKDGGYSLELAQSYFRIALSELEASGLIQPGTKENPTIINLEIAWQRDSQEEIHNELVKYFMDTFNDEKVSQGKYKLTFTFWSGPGFSVYYDKFFVGCFDLAFINLSLASINLFDYFAQYSSNKNIAGISSNSGVDTNSLNSYPLVYDNMLWTYDALLLTLDNITSVTDGYIE